MVLLEAEHARAVVINERCLGGVRRVDDSEAEVEPVDEGGVITDERVLLQITCDEGVNLGLVCATTTTTAASFERGKAKCVLPN